MESEMGSCELGICLVVPLNDALPNDSVPEPIPLHLCSDLRQPLAAAAAGVCRCFHERQRCRIWHRGQVLVWRVAVSVLPQVQSVELRRRPGALPGSGAGWWPAALRHPRRVRSGARR